MSAETVHGSVAPSGRLGLTLIRGGSGVQIDPARGFPEPPRPVAEIGLRELLEYGFPQAGLAEVVNRWRRSNLRHLLRGAWRLQAARALGLPHLHGALFLRVIRGDGSIEDLGLASLRLVTDNGMGFVVDAFQNLVELENAKYHAFGTGTTAESATDTALVTEETTQYNPDNTRPTGTTAEASQKVYQSVATYSPDSGGTRAITEHMLTTQAATGGGVCIDRSVFSAVNLVAGSDSLQATYQLTFNSGG